MAPSSGAQSSSEPVFKKRRLDNASTSNPRSGTPVNKRAKVYSARSIPSQSADAALKDGELDLQAFVAAHEFEIRSMEQSMATSKAVSMSRAFQQVPRGLRRRTASHNPKRVPRRFRARAKREMADDNTPIVEARRRKPRTTRARIRAETAKKLKVLAARKKRRKEKQGDTGPKFQEPGVPAGVVGRTPRPKIRRNQLNDPPKPAAKFRRRQLNKTWLPTHGWHAKRARMTDPKEPLWRFAIPLTPNEKIYRPTHRAQGEKGAMVWDMSYMSTIGIYGNSPGMERVLRKIGVSHESCWNDKGNNWRKGEKAWTGFVSREHHGYRRAVCPAAIFWNPEAPSSNEPQEAIKRQRQVFVRVHPAAFLEVFEELLRLTKMENPRLYIEDLRFEIGGIELTGPASTEVLHAVLHPYESKSTPKTKHAELFTSLKGLTNPATLPANSILSFTIQDPRIRYPPKKQSQDLDAKAQLDLMETIAAWPKEQNLAPHLIFDRDARYKASQLPSQKSINRRRGAAEPGTLLKLTPADPQIPILLHASRGSTSRAQGKWTLFAPWKCIQPLWYSIVHCPLSSGGVPKFGGLNEIQQVAFERGVPWFPADFLGSDAGAAWELEERAKRKKAWERRPKSKRVEWSALDLGAGRKGEVGDGLACDFEELFGLPKPPEGHGESASNEAEQPSETVAQGTTTGASRVEPLGSLNAISKDTWQDIHRSAEKEKEKPLPKNAIVNVRVKLLSRGVVGPCARIYRLPKDRPAVHTSPEAEVPATIPPESTVSTHLPADLRAQWLSRAKSSSTTRSTKQSRPCKQPNTLEVRKQQLAKELLEQPTRYPEAPPNQQDIGGHPLVPDAEDLIGFVTTGAFDLSEGRGVALGCLAVEEMLERKEEDTKERTLCIVRNAGENVGWIARWEVL